METLNVVINFFQSGGVFMYPILLIMALGTAIVVERLVYLYRISVNGRAVWLKVRGAVSEGRFKDALKVCEGSHSPLCLILQAGIEKLQQGGSSEELRGAMEEAILERLPHVEQRNHYLPTLANVATLLGLLGTIIGLIQAFAAVAAVDPSQKAALLSQGISVAMNTTAFGLVVAIPLILFYSFLLSKGQKIVEGIDEVSLKFINLTSTLERTKKERDKGVVAAAVKTY